MADTTETKPSKGADDERLIAALAYLIFFLPMLVKKDSKFAMFHAKQGLVLLLASIIGNVICSFLAIVVIGIFLMPLVNLFIFVLGVMGFIGALNGKQDELPLIGSYAKLFKF